MKLKDFQHFVDLVYKKAKSLWGEILKYNNNFDMAYLGIGKLCIEQGKYADFVILDQNVLTCDAQMLRNTKVLKTFFEGKEVYSKWHGDFPHFRKQEVFASRITREKETD